MISRKKYMNPAPKDLQLLETFSKTPAENLLFFDIETTGLSWKTSMVFLIGIIQLDPDSRQWCLTQWFLDDPSMEKELLEQFTSAISEHTFLLHYNGQQFDLPFLEGRCHVQDIFVPWQNCRQLDLYRSLRPYQKLMGLCRMKLTDLENFLGASRPEDLTGRKCISLYRKYVSEYLSGQEEPLLLHNQRDLEGLLHVLRALAYPAFFQGKFRLEQCLLVSDTLTCRLLLDEPLPQSLTLDCHPKPWTVSCTQRQAQMDFSLENGSLRMYYVNYKDYYYLPAEDTAVHKSVGIYVDAKHRKQATVQNCYTRFPCSIEFMQDLQQVEAYIRHCLKFLI